MHTFVVDSGSVTRKLKTCWVVDSGSVSRKLKKIWVIDSGGVARKVFTAGDQFNMLTDTGPPGIGFIAGDYGTVTPAGPITGGDFLKSLIYNGGINYLTLTIEGATTPLASWLIQMSIGSTTYNGSDATWTNLGSNTAQWRWISGVTPLATGTNYTVIVDHN